ncbi:MAG TPA: P-type DNA transfer ATPase VirB11 [Bradyrhizobium sp.]
MINGTVTLDYLLEPIEDLLGAPQVTEIVCQQPGEVGFENAGKWYWREVAEFDYRRLDAIGLLSGSLLSKKFDPATPICLSTLPGGQRISLVRPPAVAPGTISLTIRVPSETVYTVHDNDFEALMREAEPRTDRVDPVDAELLDLYHAKRWESFFSLAVKARKTIAATGSVGSGKTTFLRRLGREVPSEERLVTIEDTSEFGQLPLRNRVALFYGAAGVTAEEAVETSLRLRPDRIMLQELRSAEAFAYLRALAAGHPGSLTTWHAAEDDPWTPLSLMVRQHPAGREVPDDKLNKIIKGLIDIIAYCKRDEHGFHVPSVYFRTAEMAA